MRKAAFALALICGLGGGRLAWCQQDRPPAKVASAPDRADTAGRSAPATQTRDAPTYLRVNTFNIPFNTPVDPEQGNYRPVEVLLSVSADRGVNWSIYARKQSANGLFPFRASRDGEYWFVLHTLLPGMTLPRDPPAGPELRVVIDRTQPQLNVQASISAAGRVDVSWEGIDSNLDPDSLRVEYQPSFGQPWKTVNVKPSGDTTSATILRGQTHWQPSGGLRLVTVRVSLQDRAGNQTEAVRRLIVPISFGPRPATPQTLPAETVPSDPFAGYGLAASTPGPASTPPASPTESSAANSGLAADSSPSGESDWSGQDALAPGARLAADSGLGGGSDLAAEMAPAAGVAGRAAADPATIEPEQQFGSEVPERIAETEPNGVAWPSDNASVDASEARSESWPLDDDYPRSASPVGPPVARHVASRIDADGSEGSQSELAEQSSTEDVDTTPSRETGRYGLPIGERPRMTGSKRFNLDYSIDAVGPAGVEKVELWGTRNGGRDWDLWDIDEDRETPFLVKVEDEGIYGFRIVIVGNNGLAGHAPRSGDLADLWVGVDTTTPIAEITTAAYGSGGKAGHLDIRWKARDLHLGDRPIALQFSEDPEGPWTTIASGLPNNGEYAWRVDSRVPDEFYLRLEVRDEAGNTGVHQLDQSLKSAGLTPKGFVRGLTPVE